MSKYAKHYNVNKTLQSEKIPGTTQVKNSAGGFTWKVDDWTRLERFLILGSEGGSYYASENKLTIENAESVQRCIDSDGLRTVKVIVEISVSGRAPKNDPAIFALALAASKGNEATRRAVFEQLNQVCRIGTHLFQFLEVVQGFRGWGRGLRRAVGHWYLDKDIQALAYQLVKYRQRGGWEHRDVLRLAHPKPDNIEVAQLLNWAVGKEKAESLPELVNGFKELQAAKDDKEVVRILGNYQNLPWEAVPTDHLKSAKVWEALLPNLPLTALVRNLARMTANGLIAPLSDSIKIIREKLQNQEAIQKARLHPIALLGALATYKEGKGQKGSLTWQPVTQIVDVLDEAFYLSFKAIEPTNKRWLLALDVSGSMGWSSIAGMPGVTPAIGSAAMAMVTARTEQDWYVMGFSNGLVDIPITPKQRLDTIVKHIAAIPMGGTDCSLPMVWALNNKIKVDQFVVYTDSETWAGEIHASQALVQYREKMGINAKLIVVGMVANEFTIADPNDAGMMDVVGFDTAAPMLMANFAKS